MMMRLLTIIALLLGLLLSGLMALAIADEGDPLAEELVGYEYIDSHLVAPNVLLARFQGPHAAIILYSVHNSVIQDIIAYGIYQLRITIYQSSVSYHIDLISISVIDHSALQALYSYLYDAPVFDPLQGAQWAL